VPTELSDNFFALGVPVMLSAFQLENNRLTRLEADEIKQLGVGRSGRA
jgi:magnesium transporter